MTQKEKDKMLMDAIMQNNLKGIKNALKLGANVNASGFGRSALYHCPLIASVDNCSSLEIVKILLDSGADINIRDLDDNTALLYSVVTGNTGVVRMLLDAGAETDTINRYGYTPLMYGARQGNTGIMALLVKAGADTSIKNHDGKTAIALLKEMHPDKYSEWIKQVKGRILEHEDRVLISAQRHGPDFNI